MKNLALPTGQGGLPSKQEKSKTQLALDARLLPSEAFKAVSSMIAGFAHKGQADDGYITTIANVLVRYPRSVAIKCAHPIDGVVRQTKFLPTPSVSLTGVRRRRARCASPQIARTGLNNN